MKNLPSLLRVLFLPAVLLATTPVHARLGETLAQLKERFGRPEPHTQKNGALWFFEAEDGRLAYSVTFNARGRSIAEGIKPVRRARLTVELAEDFIKAQLSVLKNSKTTRTVKPGERYEFARQAFVCAEAEHVIVDEPNGFLLVWTRGSVPTIMVISPEMLK